MDSYMLILAASSGKNLELAQRFSEAFDAEGVASQVIDLTTLHWPVYTPELDGDAEQEPDTSTLSDLILNSKGLGRVCSRIQWCYATFTEQHNRLAIGSKR